MDGFFLRDSISRLLQDNAAFFWTPASANRSPITISMTTRIISSSPEHGGSSGSGLSLGLGSSSPAPIEAQRGQQQQQQQQQQSPPAGPTPSSSARRRRHVHAQNQHQHQHQHGLPASSPAADVALPRISTLARDPVTLPPPSSLFWHGPDAEDSLFLTDDDLMHLAEPPSPPPPPQTSISSAAVGAATRPLAPDDDDNDPFLAVIADSQFSSPSTYPSFTQLNRQPQTPSRNRPLRPAAVQASAAGEDTAPRSGNNDPPGGACVAALNPERSTTQLSASTVGESQTTVNSNNDLFADDIDSLFDSPASSFSDAHMPSTTATRRRSGGATTATSPHDHAHPSKRRRTSNNSCLPPLYANAKTASRGRAAQATKPDETDDDFFELSRLPAIPGEELKSEEDLATIDLTEANGPVQEPPKEPEKDNRTKLAAFQCVICMDDVTALTVTHCGHLYCAQCLHSSLTVEATRGKCPMCRQKLDMKPRAQYNSKTKGFWPLELKLMTATRKGKRKADTAA